MTLLSLALAKQPIPCLWCYLETVDTSSCSV